MTTTAGSGPERRRHAGGAATRDLLMDAAERLFALSGIESVTLREIQTAAGQANSSVITYHFGSKSGLVEALVRDRYQRIDLRRRTLFEEARAAGTDDDPRTVVLAIVRPLLDSLAAGEMFVPFLARLIENSRTRAEFRPRDLSDASSDVLTEMLSKALEFLPERLRRGRQIQLHNSVLNLLGEHAVGGRDLPLVRLSNYVDGWVAVLTAPPSPQTLALLAQQEGEGH